MTKLYKAVDKADGIEWWVLVNDKGAAWMSPAKIETIKFNEKYYAYEDSETFENRAIDPVLIAEW